ncbi:MAG: AbrB/MazE/SpoVT family DNA-binding domain-containing protein [Nitrospirae bacterium]|nr:AbrB/MazE/SpoVT family DNA-binding domain-containing protein [Nitrospirota bacterium]MCL5237638.1 AbrB/MazE/SpoVT family DNA-binding domain-containing protein [Nitrospirota bacterium]
MLVQVKKKAQITIPLKVREAVGITEGDVLDIEVRNKEIILKPVHKAKIKLRPVPASELKKLEGIFSIGGDAVKDTEDLYNE